MSAPAGWHPDPSGAAGLRWWDGAAWTEHTQQPGVGPLPTAGPVPTSGPMFSAAYRPGATMTEGEAKALPFRERNSTGRPDIDLALGRNTPARDSLIAGVLSLFFCQFGVVAIGGIVFASIGLMRAGKWQAQGLRPVGRGQAIGGLVLSLVGFVLAIAWTVQLFQNLPA